MGSPSWNWAGKWELAACAGGKGNVADKQTAVPVETKRKMSATGNPTGRITSFGRWGGKLPESGHFVSAPWKARRILTASQGRTQVWCLGGRRVKSRSRIPGQRISLACICKQWESQKKFIPYKIYSWRCHDSSRGIGWPLFTIIWEYCCSTINFNCELRTKSHFLGQRRTTWVKFMCKIHARFNRQVYVQHQILVLEPSLTLRRKSYIQGICKYTWLSIIL